MARRSNGDDKGRRAHGEGGLFQLADGRWVARLDLGWQDGKRKRREGRFKTERAARQALSRWRRDHEDGLPIAPERLTVGVYLLDWLDNAIKPRRRASTYVAYKKHIDLHLAPTIGKIKLARLQAGDVERMMNALLAGNVPGRPDRQRRGRRALPATAADARPLSPRTVREVRGTLRTALNRAVKHGLVPRNVAALVDLPEAPRFEGRALTAEEAAQLLSTVRGDRLEALYTVALALGLRQGEALGLRWEDVNLDSGSLNVRRQIQRIGGKLQAVDLKTDKSRRILDLPDFAVDALRTHKVRQLEERLALGAAWQESGFVFTTALGTPLDARNVIRQFKKHLVRAELPPEVRFHDLRHSAASLLRAQGVPLEDIRDLLGHSQISITVDLYAHIQPQARRDMATKMQALLGVK